MALIGNTSKTLAVCGANYPTCTSSLINIAVTLAEVTRPARQLPTPLALLIPAPSLKPIASSLLPTDRNLLPSALSLLAVECSLLPTVRTLLPEVPSLLSEILDRLTALRNRNPACRNLCLRPDNIRPLSRSMAESDVLDGLILILLNTNSISLSLVLLLWHGRVTRLT